MLITPYRTEKIMPGDDLVSVIGTAIPVLKERSILCVTSKIVSICEGSVTTFHSDDEKRDLIRRQSSLYLDSPLTRRYGYQLSVTRSIIIPNAGIDESNGNGSAILWPKDPMQSARTIWEFMKNRFSLTKIGVIITDSHTTMLRWGTTGIGLAWCGFAPLRSYIGKPDIFGRTMRVTKSNLLDGLAAASVFTMGEGNEQTPLAVIEEPQNVVFVERPPTAREQSSVRIPIEQDMYAPLLTAVRGEKGGVR